MIKRICTKCETEYPATNKYFGKKPGGKYGLESRCKSCLYKYQKQWTRSNSDKVTVRDKRHYEKNKSVILEKARKKNKSKESREYHKNYEKIRRKEYRDKMLKLNNYKCQICGKDLSNPKKQTFAEHHLSYNKDIKALICKGCHMWLHGQSAVYNHIFKKRFNPDISPYIFAKGVVDLYENRNPIIVEEWNRMRCELDINEKEKI